MMKILKSLLPCFCLLIIVAVGCNKAHSKKSRPATHTVVISGMQFHPDSLNVAKGDTVKWINKDIVTHNVTEYPGKKWTSGPITPGASWKKVITHGFNYFCSIHPNMKGKITVKKAKNSSAGSESY
jgi:plastocyanin